MNDYRLTIAINGVSASIEHDSREVLMLVAQCLAGSGYADLKVRIEETKPLTESWGFRHFDSFDSLYRK